MLFPGIVVYYFSRILGISGNVPVSALPSLDNLFKPLCDFDCLHGHCDTSSRICICSPGWAGSSCDFCLAGGVCEPLHPFLSLILPQAGPVPGLLPLSTKNLSSVEHQNFVFAYGHDLPKHASGRYNCLFGTVATQGLWLSNELVQCAVPERVPIGKLIFNIVPAKGSKEPVPYSQGTKHFTFFVPCDPVKCEGSCLGPLCLCGHQKHGLSCEYSTIDLGGVNNATNLAFLNETKTSYFGNEWRPLVVELAKNVLAFSKINPKILSASNFVQLDFTDFPDDATLEMDWSRNLLIWRRPVGRSTPYTFRFKIRQPGQNVTSETKESKLHVEPSYLPVLQNSLDEPRVNGIVVLGEVFPLIETKSQRLKNETFAGEERNGGKLPKRRLPVELRVFAVDSTDRTPLDTMQIWTAGGEERFRHRLFPFSPMNETLEDVIIFATHPGVSRITEVPKDARKFWAIPTVHVSGYTAEHSVEHGNNFVDTYEVHLSPSESEKGCREQWRVQVIQPSQLIRASILNSSTPYLSVEFNLFSFWVHLISEKAQIVRTAFICGTANAVISQAIFPQNFPASNTYKVLLNPEKLFVSVPFESTRNFAPSMNTIEIEFLEDSQENNGLSGNILRTASYAPFDLVWLNQAAPNVWKLWLILQANWTTATSGTPLVEGVIVVQGSSKFVLSIPYSIKREVVRSEFPFTLTLMAPDFVPSAHKIRADVTLYSTKKKQSFSRNVPLNTPILFESVTMDLFQLLISSSAHFQPFSSILKLNSQNNSFVVYLIPKPTQFFAFDGVSFSSETFPDSYYPGPRIHFSSSSFPLFNSRFGRFIDIIFTNGTEPASGDSFVGLQDGIFSSSNVVPFRLEVDMSGSAICAGCGLRQLLHLSPQQQDTGSNSDSSCSAWILPVPFESVLSGQNRLLFSFFLIDLRPKHNRNVDFLGIVSYQRGQEYSSDPIVCYERSNLASPSAPPLAEKTPIWRSCLETKLRHCRSLYRPAAFSIACTEWWRQIPDNLLTVHTLAQFLLMSTSCKISGTSFTQMRKTIDCISSIEMDCPLNPVDEALSPHASGQLFNQMGMVLGQKKGVFRSLFPQLNPTDAQLLNLPLVLGDFIDQLEQLFPRHELSAFDDSGEEFGKRELLYDALVLALSDDSAEGSRIAMEELLHLITISHDDNGISALRDRWNLLGWEVLKGGNVDVIHPGNIENTMLAHFQTVVDTADRLKSITRQFGARDPITLFDELLKKLFSDNLRDELSEDIEKIENSDDDNDDDQIAEASVFVQPELPGTANNAIIEGEEFRLTILVRNIQAITEIRNLDFDIQFPMGNLRYRMGPVTFLPASAKKVLKPDEALVAQWIVTPFSEFRLTRTVVHTPKILLTFDHDGGRKTQRLRAPRITVSPKPSIRLLVFLRPTVREHSETRRFTLMAATINSGYSNVSTLELLEFRAHIVSPNQSSNQAFSYRIDSMELDGQEFGQTGGMNLGPIPSGSSRHLAMNITLQGLDRLRLDSAGGEALFHGALFTVSVDGRLLGEDQVDQRVFLIQDELPFVADSSLLASELSMPVPLYFYAYDKNRLVPLTNLQMLEKKEGPFLINGHQFFRLIVVYRKMAILTPEGESTNGANTSSSIQQTTAVFGAIEVPTKETFENGAKLLKVSELLSPREFTGGVQQYRQLRQKNVWIGDSDERSTTIKFVDLEASAVVPELFFEFLFGRPENFHVPYFPEASFQLKLPQTELIKMSASGEGGIIARIQAISPSNSALNYSLLGKDDRSPFQVIPSTGDIILRERRPISVSRAYCFNLAASDLQGRSTKVPVEIHVVPSPFAGPRTTGGECQLFTREELASHQIFVNNYGTPPSNGDAEEDEEGEHLETSVEGQIHWDTITPPGTAVTVATGGPMETTTVETVEVTVESIGSEEQESATETPEKVSQSTPEESVVETGETENVDLFTTTTTTAFSSIATTESVATQETYSAESIPQLATISIASEKESSSTGDSIVVFPGNGEEGEQGEVVSLLPPTIETTTSSTPTTAEAETILTITTEETTIAVRPDGLLSPAPTKSTQSVVSANGSENDGGNEDSLPGQRVETVTGTTEMLTLGPAFTGSYGGWATNGTRFSGTKATKLPDLTGFQQITAFPSSLLITPDQLQSEMGRTQETEGLTSAGWTGFVGQVEGNSPEEEARHAALMAETACRLRSIKPIWALICDMSRTVERIYP